jgi:diguanylate cyclase (GGDEF)-like protein
LQLHWGSCISRLLESGWTGRGRTNEPDTKTIEADHDGLTGLANRRMVERELDALANTKDPKDFALLYLDLDQFKTVNDRFGHAAGDEILKAVARRLQGAVRSDAIVARVGGDEFAFIVPDLEHESEVRIVAERVMLAFDQPFRLGDSQIDVRASIGVDVTTETNRNPDDLRRNADRAMYEMKHARQADASGQSG